MKKFIRSSIDKLETHYSNKSLTDRAKRRYLKDPTWEPNFDKMSTNDAINMAISSCDSWYTTHEGSCLVGRQSIDSEDGKTFVRDTIKIDFPGNSIVINEYPDLVDSNPITYVSAGVVSMNFQFDSEDDILPLLPESAKSVLESDRSRYTPKSEPKYEKSQSGPKYTIYVCNNEAAANRSSLGDTCEKFVERHETDRDAAISGLLHQGWLMCKTIEEVEQELGDEDPFKVLQYQDIGGGDPFVYGIKKGNTFIFKLDGLELHDEDGEPFDPFKIY